MNRRIFGLIASFAVAFIIGFSGCGGNQQSETVNIGTTLDLTGPNATYGDQVKKGLDLAVEEVNAQGGIQGKKIQITYLDSKSDPKLAVTNAQQLIAVNNSKLLLGEISSSATQAMIPVVEQNGAFLFAPASSSPKLTNVSKNFARNWPSDVAEAGSAAQFAKDKLNGGTASIIYVNSDYGIGLKDKFTQVFESFGGKVVSSEPYEVGATDFRTLMLKVKAADPEVIYLAGNPKEMGIAIKQLKDTNIPSKIVSDTGFLQNDCLSLAGVAADGVIVPTPDYNPAESKDNRVSDFSKKFKAKYNADPTMVSANAYDAIYLIKDAIEHVGNDPAKIAEFIRNKKNFNGAAGVVSFVDGDVEVPITFKIIENGRPVNYAK
ncbi:MAG: ABC transporter substrate-binding protein [Chloracidobacterium sp.]|nr:ABC transporter substrate-binding protein [Chloracidobacterium sp.]